MNISATQEKSSIQEEFFAFATSPSYETETPFLISSEKMTGQQNATTKSQDDYKKQFDLSQRGKDANTKEDKIDLSQKNSQQTQTEKKGNQVLSTKQLKAHTEHLSDFKASTETKTEKARSENSNFSPKEKEKLTINPNTLRASFFIEKQQVTLNERVKNQANKVISSGINDASKSDRVLPNIQLAKTANPSGAENNRIKEFSNTRDLTQNFTKTETNSDSSSQRENSNSQSDNKDESHRSFEKFIRQTAEVTNSSPTEFSTQLSETEAEKVLSRTELSQKILDQVERLRKTSNKHLRVTLQLPDGEKLGVRLNLNGQNVRVRFLTSSPEVRRNLEESWEKLHQDAETRGVTIGSPEFEDDPLLTKSRSSKQPNAALQQFA